MTTIDEGPIIKRNARLPSSEEGVCIPQQLTEANELLNSINRRLEDCALEWQADISRKQWKIFNSKVIGENSLEQFLLARTYFSEKSLDEAFQHLLSCNKIFSEYLRSFIALLRGEQTALNTKETRDAQNQCSNLSENLEALNDSIINPMHSSLPQSQHLNDTGNPENFVDNVSLVQNSFTDLIKAKVNFDTKFLGFEAVLHKTTSFPRNAVCLCQYCSKAMRATRGSSKKLRNITVSQRSQKISKPKRLTRSTRSFFRKKEIGGPSMPAGEIGDQPSFETNRSFC
ncbi:uncharacterized protein LOC143370309 [Andrena cerasifolii]|uniref:uncharacterized protein LOC143370309 n=1 Tax=Andrena cerasifolii TaxID=2819439 RepID=UPI0040383D20